MQAFNNIKNTHLTNNLISPTSLFDKSFGLLKFRNSSLLLKTRFGIHTFGLSTPIDVLILDNKHRVLKLKQSLKPNKIFFWNPRFNIVLELPEGSIKKSKTEIGDIIVIHF